MVDKFPRVAIIILNWNNVADTLECLASVWSMDYHNFSTIVVDNGSTDESVATIRAQFPTIMIIENGANLGFAAGNNRGIEYACKMGFEWVFLLNSDTVLASDCLSEMLRVAENDPTIGILGPMVYHYNEPEVIQSAGCRLDRSWVTEIIGQNQVDKGQFATPFPVDWLAGCAMFVRCAASEQVGLLDERFFMYWEETDWCLRAQRAGWRILLVPQAKVWHKGVQRNYRPQPQVTYYSTRNRFLFLAKHDAPLMAWIWAWGETLRTLTSWTFKPKWRSMKEHRDAIWQGVWDSVHCGWGRRPE